MSDRLNQTLDNLSINRIDIEQKILESLHERLAANFMATFFAATLIFVVIWTHETNQVYLIWYLLTIFIVLARLIENAMYKKHIDTGNEVSLWKDRFDTGTLASGAVWGFLASVIAPSLTTEVHSLILLFCGGLLSAAVIAYQASLRTYLAFALPIIIPVGIVYIASGDLIDVVIGVMMFCFAGILSTYLIKVNKRFIEHITLEAQNSALISTLQYELEEHERSKQALSESEARHQDFFDNADDVIYKTDARANLTYVNKMVEQRTGYERQELLKMKSLDFIAPDYKLQIKKLYLEKARAKIAKFKHETPVIRKNNEIIWGEMNVRCIFENGKAKEYQVVVRETTKRREMEQALRNAKEEALSAKATQEQFIASISHEIRTPMNAVTGFVDLLSNMELTQEQRKYLNGLDLSSKRLLNVINDLLDMSKIQSGQLTFNLSRMNIIDAIASIIETLRPQADAKKLTFESQLIGKIPKEIVFDSLRFDQIMQNLLSNAVKYTHKGKIRVIIKVFAYDAKRVQLQISVKDDGIGIPEDKLGKIFQDFHQVHDKPDEYHGTGLGLSIVKKLVAMRGGEVFASSKLNKGSTIGFTMLFEIPENVEKIEGDFDDTTTSDNNILKRKNLKSLKLLIADDNDMNLMIITKIMEDYTDNIIIDNAINGAEAFEKVKSGSYDLIFMDLQMPEMDGYLASSAIRELSGATGKVPIMALTAALPPITKLYDAGMDDFLLKPFTREALYDKTDQILGI